ncbi:actin related protein 2:3 complex subunit 2 [Echinococcus multilocularis]|uniref:Arp2/3 complex 34 kDa subunit n=1 Tax=Echinococcus multilocularis TaxID=6211 RepID=A0A068Y321_ECHMU|nr:actin related protein 2:3 complex subunit 2 [Echinococcus multilocularis]
MILIEPFHSAVRDVVLAQLQAYKNHLQRPDKFQTVADINDNVADFDGILYAIVQKPDSHILTVSISLPFYKEIEKFGGSKVLVREYGSYLKPGAQSGTSVTLQFDCNHLPDNLEDLATKAALLRRNCFASVFEHFFDYQVANASSPSAKILQGTIHFRSDETMFVQAMSDRVTVIFSTRFKDLHDIVLGKVFLQEFSEAKRRYDGAPQVIYQHRDPPKELRGTDAVSGENIFYITFVLLPRHVSAQNRAKTIDLIHLMRTYMHYHIKCMKAYLQMRMRAKTSEFLKILNRAHPNADSVTARAYAISDSDISSIQMLRSSTSFRKVGPS